MSDNLRAYTKALYGFDHVVRLIPSDGWDQPTPCEGWTARDVVGHVVAVQRYIESLIADRAPTLNPYESPGAIAGGDPAATWSHTRDDLLGAMDAPGVLHRTVQSFRGPESVDSAIGWNVVDTLTHAWDLARSAGVDDRLDPVSVRHALSMAAPMITHMRHPPFFGPAASVGDDADPQATLLAMLGRSTD